MYPNKSMALCKLIIVLIGDAHLSASSETVFIRRGGSCSAIGQLLPLQTLWQVSRTSHTKGTSPRKRFVFGFRVNQQIVYMFSFLFVCPRMFYKIKSRNAHMKIHRQPQEDWADRRLQHQLLTQRLALSHSANILPSSGSNLLSTQTPVHTFPSPGSSSMDNVHNTVTNSNPITPSNANDLDPALSYGSTAPQNSHAIHNIDNSIPKEPGTALSFPQSWGSFVHHVDQTTFYCQPEGKEDVGAGTVGGKEQVNWQ